MLKIVPVQRCEFNNCDQGDTHDNNQKRTQSGAEFKEVLSETIENIGNEVDGVGQDGNFIFLPPNRIL